MIDERIKTFILELTNRTKQREFSWDIVTKINTWENIKRQIEESREIDLKYYLIDERKSYFLEKERGYVLVLNLKYGNAPIFSPALDKCILVIKVNDDFPPQNIIKDSLQEYKGLLQDLVEEIEHRKREMYRISNDMYNFFERVLGE